MAVFDESKVINTLHRDKAEVGKRYYCADYIDILKQGVEHNNSLPIGELIQVTDDINCCFLINDFKFALLYPYEGEQQKKRMTNRQLAEWLARGNGQLSVTHWTNAHISYDYDKEHANEEVPSSHRIRPWDSDTWIKPTVDIYMKDCKHISQDEIEDVAYRDGC